MFSAIKSSETAVTLAKSQWKMVFTAKKEAYILRTISEGHYGPSLSNALGFETF